MSNEIMKIIEKKDGITTIQLTFPDFLNDMKNKNLLDTKLLENLKSEVNCQEIIFNKFKNIDGKNKWGIICSAMDWINVGIYGVYHYDKTIRDVTGNDHSIQLLSFVMHIDNIFDSVKQLYRVFFNIKKKVFIAKNEVFLGNQFHDSDDEYFKMIRACCSAHQSNLCDNFTSNEKEKRYAAWSNEGNLFCAGDRQHIGNVKGKKADSQIQLYCNDPTKQQVILNIYFDELITFVQKVYQHLIPLTEEVVRQHENKYKGVIS